MYQNLFPIICISSLAFHLNGWNNNQNVLHLKFPIWLSISRHYIVSKDHLSFHISGTMDWSNVMISKFSEKTMRS